MLIFLVEGASSEDDRSWRRDRLPKGWDGGDQRRTKAPRSDWVLYQDGAQEWANYGVGLLPARRPARNLKPVLADDPKATAARAAAASMGSAPSTSLARTRSFTPTSYTNLGLGGPIDWRLAEAGKESLLEASSLIELHRGRGRDELVYRALEDSPAERMPFEPLLIRAPPNMSSARAVPGAFNLYETFKEGRFKADGEEESPPRPEFPSPSTLRVCAGR